MTKTASKFSALLILATSGTLLLGGTAHAMEFNDDADLDTTVVTDTRGCGGEGDPCGTGETVPDYDRTVDGDKEMFPDAEYGQDCPYNPQPGCEGY